MTNNLRKISQDLRTFAKRTKDFKYTDSALIVFLMTGMIFTAINIFGASEESGIKNQVNQINSSINQIRTDFKKARKENNKLVKDTTLELIQLTEQGDHVVKSPWSSWQYGINYFNNNWNGTYKGRGDKKEKYPYEGILERSTDPYERSISPQSKNYSLLSTSSNPRSASSNNRQGLSGYGIASFRKVNEPIVAFEVSAGINPRVFTAPTVTPLSATQPNLPQAINFRPATPNIDVPTVAPIVIPTITPPTTGNGDNSWIYTKEGSLKNEKNTGYNPPSGYVGAIAQQDMDGGTLTVTGQGNRFDIDASGIKFTGRYNADHNASNSGAAVLDFNTSGGAGYLLSDGVYAAMKLVGGHEIKINSNIKYNGTGTSAYNRWLFHTDGHNDNGDSTWHLMSGGNINMNGDDLVMYTSQYHGSGNYNIGFLNEGTITTSSTGNRNYIWLPLSAGNWGGFRAMMFENKGTISLNGTGDVLSVFGSEGQATGGISFINSTGTLELNGESNKGIVVKSGLEYPSGEILLNTPMKVKGNNSVGVAFLGYIDLDGGANFHKSNANNVIIDLPASSRESILNVDLSDNTKSTALYFENGGTNAFTINDFNLTSTNGQKNNLVYVANGIVNLNGTTNGQMTITGGKSNIGIYTAASGDPLTNKGNITISNSDSSIGILASGSGTVTNTGKISATGASVKALVADNSTITSSGKVDVTGTALSDSDGAVGLVATNGGSLTQTGGGDITVDGSASIGALGQKGGTVDITGGTIKATGGAFNTYAQGGTVKLNGTTINTEQKSLAFYADNTGGTGKINFTGATTANIAGGTDANTRGTAFYYKGSGYSPFTASDIGTWASNTFGGTINNLTLNMASGSRLFIASDVSMNLSDTAGSGLTSSLGANIVGNDYKTFMLYLSKLALNQSIDLDNANDAYNQLEISNSSIDNNNSNTITGTQAGQTAIAQENLTTNRNAVTLNNDGSINLSGANSTGMYAKFGVLNNNATGTITLGDTSTGLYGVADSILTNTGTITMGSSSTGMYSEGSTTQGVTNAGTITSSGTTSVGVLFKPDATLAAGAVLGNTGNITLGDNSVGLYGDSTATNYTTSNSGNITVGQNGIGMFGYASKVSGGTITVGDKGVGVYSQGGNVDLTGGTIATGASEAVGVYTVGNGQTVTNSGTTFNLGNSSVAIANSGTGNTINSTVANVGLGDNNIYVYSNDAAGTVTNSTNLSATGSGNYGIYSAGTVTNSGNMDFGNGIGNVGVYSIGGGTATNTGTITIGGSNAATNAFGIGMAAGYQNSDTGNVINNGTINVNGDYSIGMYASGAGSTATNGGNIVLNANNTTGIYADNGATVTNTGSISTASGNYSNVVGVYLGKGSTLNNTGSINIDGANGVGVYLKGGTIANYGNITVNGSSNQADTVQEFTTPPTGKSVGGAAIDAPAGAQTATVTINGVQQTPVVVNTFATNPIDVSASSIGLYVNTSGKDFTNSINGLGNLTQEADLIIGTEATEMTNSKSILINDSRILDPYNNAIRTSGVANWNIYSGGLNWLATPTLNPNDGTMTSIYMVKIPYTAWAGKEETPINSSDTYNFLDGLEQRYGVENLGTRERALFGKLNSIGKNEAALFYQATDEMMGHQYGNVQQRINSTGNLLDKELNHLQRDWRNPSKQSNKIKVFGMR
ncbi:autotransporter-associated N-terminal domain-containing protein, partial [Leptotrichia hongkongensis]